MGQNYIIFNPLTGKILKTGRCVSAALPDPPDGMAVMQGVANDILQKIVEGEIVYKSAHELPSPKTKSPPRKILLQSEWDELIKRMEILER